jgi:peptidoglycan hydrolase-like protein with peptidoglycan-binding domain
MSLFPGRRSASGSTSFFADWSDAERSGAAQDTFLDVDISTSRRAIRRAELRSDLWARTARVRRGGLVLGLAGASVATVAVVLHGATASADPSAQTWHRLRMCESSNNYKINTGNGYYGAYQFDLSTWRSVGGSGYPNQASPAEQDARALILYRKRGWQPWTCASILGLRGDSDAGSGRIGDIHVPTGSGGSGSGGSSSGGVPDFPGHRSYVYGDWNNQIKRFQNEMHHRGYFPAGTGQYGPLTLAMVKQLQRLNGLTPSGLLGPLTWPLAWTGKYIAPATTPGPTPVPPTRHRHHRRHRHHQQVPVFPGKRSYVYGDWNNQIKRFQNEMHHRGYFPAGTGQYGPLTLAMVKQLQRLNGLTPSGLLGPKTWRLAWTGRYSRP